MKRMMIRKVARFTVNLCDWMMGYHGKIIEEVICAVAIAVPTVFFLMWFIIVMS